MNSPIDIDPLGPNAWLVDEYREQWEADPASVDERWQTYFSSANGAGSASDAAVPAQQPTAPATGSISAAAPPSVAAPATPAPASSAAAPSAPATAAATATAPAPTVATPASPTSAPSPAPTAPAASGGVEPQILRGVSSKIVENMELSLDVPTATSFRDVPAKLLEVNRKVMNGHLQRTARPKVSYTHIIGYAIVRAIADTLPAMNRTFARNADGQPTMTENEHVGLGLAIDLERNGKRTLVVPCIKNADTLNFAEFCAAYDDVVSRAKANKLTLDDYTGLTVSLTNPGTLGTRQSVPRLMPGQGVIVGVGSMDYPAEWAGADQRTVTTLGISKVMTLTSTYDHRVIQGAESGRFLQTVAKLLVGEDGYYERIFADIGVPYVAVQWRNDVTELHGEDEALDKQMGVATLINMYRTRGHLLASLDPLSVEAPDMHDELDPATYGLTIWDLDREFLTGSEKGPYARLGGQRRMPLGEILRVLRNAYCRTIGIEFMHISDVEQKRWIQERVEAEHAPMPFDQEMQLLRQLVKAEAFETFLATKYVGQKRFGLEGAESAIPILNSILNDAAEAGLDSAYLGMAHRGRLNVLVNVMGKSYGELFAEFEDYLDDESVQGSGDVKYHVGQKSEYVTASGATMPVTLAANPSHLEAVNPVVEGMARARMDSIPYDPERRYPVLPILVHGDAAFAGQGVVAETLNLSNIVGYKVGGTIHLVINNQLGFTTPPKSARSSEYCTDIAKTIQAPIFHVNSDDPEACMWVARLAFEYRQAFKRDVVIDMVCYRRHGHNEGDDPSYTQPEMYKRINALPSVRSLYTDRLERAGEKPGEIAAEAESVFKAELEAALKSTRDYVPTVTVAAEREPVVEVPDTQTAVSEATLGKIFEALNALPDGFTIHPKLAQQFQTRRKMFENDRQVDWALGEAFAFGTLLLEGKSVRLAGQDSRRGTFSHRHSTLVDNVNGDEFVPLAQLETNDHKLWIYDSLLSEYAALGFEYGYSVQDEDAMVMWEAQFGDFANGAQIIIDQFIVASEDKWKEHSALTLLLPHGYEGQGPEHSSARVERFVLLAADDNMSICNATSAAQFFHLLRRQSLRDVRTPLVVFTPKSGLRAKEYRSGVDELLSGTFQEVIADSSAPPADTVERVVLTFGKVGHEAIAHRNKVGAKAAVLRMDQIFPWPSSELASLLEQYPNCTDLVWLQEEPRNMGAWNGIKGYLFEELGDRYHIHQASRAAAGSPATGSKAIHVQEQAAILERAFGPIDGLHRPK